MEKYWFEDLNILLDTNRLDAFYPTNCMNYKTKVNSLVRGSIYIGIILSVLKKNYLMLYIPLITMLMTLILYYLREINQDTDKRIQELNEETNMNSPINNNLVDNALNNKIKENFVNQVCQPPTTNNPFMNALPFDKRSRSNACPVNEENKNKIESIFNVNLFREVGDIFNKQHGQRQFYTMPSTTYPNNRDKLGDWLYKTPPTCKEGNGAACVQQNQERLNGQSYNFPHLY